MPTLDDTHTSRRLQRRIGELEAGKEIAKKDIRAVLNDQQWQALEAALAEQQGLKKRQPARTNEQKRALGWKTIREVRLEVLKRALAEAEGNELEAWKSCFASSTMRCMPNGEVAPQI